MKPNLINAEYSDYFDKYYYEDKSIISVFDDMIVYFGGGVRIVLNRYENTWTYQEVDKGNEDEILYLPVLEKDALFQQSTLFDAFIVREVQREIKRIDNTGGYLN